MVLVDAPDTMSTSTLAANAGSKVEAPMVENIDKVSMRKAMITNLRRATAKAMNSPIIVRWKPNLDHRSCLGFGGIFVKVSTNGDRSGRYEWNQIENR